MLVAIADVYDWIIVIIDMAAMIVAVAVVDGGGV